MGFRPQQLRATLVTDYVDIYYVFAFDVGEIINVLTSMEYLLREWRRFSNPVGFFIASLPEVSRLRKEGWEIVPLKTTWVQGLMKSGEKVGDEIKRYVKLRLEEDSEAFSEEFLSRLTFARLLLGEVSFNIGEVCKGKLGEVSVVRGLLEVFIHKNGVFVLTLGIPLYGIKLTSTDVLRLRYVLENGEAKVRLPSRVYMTWASLKGGREVVEPKQEFIEAKLKVWELLDMYASIIKYLMFKLRGCKVRSLDEIESMLRNPWEVSHVAVFTELTRGKMRAGDLLRSYSTQLYAILHGTRRATSKGVARNALIKSFYYVPPHSIAELVRKPARVVNVTRVYVLATEVGAHIVSLSDRYLSNSDVGLKLRYAHKTVLELIHHLRQSLRVYEFMLSHKRYKNMDELVNLRSEYSDVNDLLENEYFLRDKDLRDLFTYLSRIARLDKLSLSVERKFEAANYVVMTKYQDKINKMQLVLTMLFGIFGVPFFLFSYIQWVFDYVVEGRSPHFWPVTVLTFFPTITIFLLTLYLYIKWRKEVFT